MPTQQPSKPDKESKDESNKVEVFPEDPGRNSSSFLPVIQDNDPTLSKAASSKQFDKILKEEEKETPDDDSKMEKPRIDLQDSFQPEGDIL